MDNRVAIIGLGYVGLPLLVSVAQSGWTAIGVDSDGAKIESLLAGKSYIEDVDGEVISMLKNQGKIQFSSIPKNIQDCKVVVFCIPTPIENDKPDLSVLLSAIEKYAPYFNDQTLIISESSSFPGTLREKIIPICEKFKGDKAFFYGHSPERVDPGNAIWNSANTPRIISGIDKESLQKVREFYGSFCSKLVDVETPEIAEAAKMFENSFRQVNIALVNEFSRYCHKVGIPARDVLEAASTKPFGFMKFNYGVGVGGHCIPVDPHYLLDHARRNGTDIQLIDISNQINFQQPRYVMERAQELLGIDSGIKRILVVGISYKSNTSDTRESPSLDLINLLKESKYEVSWFDPLCNLELQIPEAKPGDGFDLAIVVTVHKDFSYSEMLSGAKKILDCTNHFPISDNTIQL